MERVNDITIRKEYPREKDYIVWEYEDSFNTMYVYKDFNNDNILSLFAVWVGGFFEIYFHSFILTF